MPSEQLPVEQRHRDLLFAIIGTPYKAPGGFDKEWALQHIARYERDHMRPSPSGDDWRRWRRDERDS